MKTSGEQHLISLTQVSCSEEALLPQLANTNPATTKNKNTFFIIIFCLIVNYKFAAKVRNCLEMARNITKKISSCDSHNFHNFSCFFGAFKHTFDRIVDYGKMSHFSADFRFRFSVKMYVNIRV